VGLVRFEPKIEAAGLEHSFYPIHPLGVPDSLLATVGDFIHNLRNVLDHLAYNLVRAGGHRPDSQVTFPVCHTETVRNRCTGAEEPSIKIDLRPDIRAWIDSVQPYKRTETGHRLALLQNLDIVDKHRSQLVTVMAAGALRKKFTRETWSDASRFPAWDHIWLSEEPFEHDRKCLTVFYGAPQLQIDPYLTIPVKILFGPGSPGAGQPVAAVVDDLMRLVGNELLPGAAPLFGVDLAKRTSYQLVFGRNGTQMTERLGPIRYYERQRGP
jgi:hypothetical protein